MTITYIFHSGFVVETDNFNLVLDYWMDPAGVMPHILESDKPLYVLSSHFHEDHFNAEILSWRSRRQAPTTYLLSKDILRHRRAVRDDADAWLAKGKTWEDDRIKVTATGSTDSGVSWIVQWGDIHLFHAGDLNNWYATFLTDNYAGGHIMTEEFGEIDPLHEEKAYLGELKDIRKLRDGFDIVMFPIDGRVGNGYTRGARQFIDRFRVKLFVPMHFAASGFESAWRMREFTEPKKIPFCSINHEGDRLTPEL